MLKVYNTLTRDVQPFKPIKKGRINLFVCGVTTYDYAHIGHAKSYIQFDVIARYLKFSGFDVFYLQNVTDIDDKIINRAQEKGEDWMKLTRFFEKAYHQDMNALNVASVNKFARATDYIPQLLKQISRLKKKGFAYETMDGIYFDIQTFKEYGKLSQQPLKKLTRHRIAADMNKRHPGDFVIWKKHKPGEPKWSSAYGDGRPGWHIEDTAVTEHFFGESYDIHGGGIDLIFPHHEAEIALMESLSKRPLAHYWIHNGFLMVNGEKMSKSLNNFTTIRDAIKRWGADAVRYLFSTSHYRSQINFTEDSIKAAQAGFEKLQNSLRDTRQKMDEAKRGKINTVFLKKIDAAKEAFEVAMDDDFNTPRAAAAVFDIGRLLNTAQESKQTLSKALKLFTELVDVLGLKIEVKIAVPQEVTDLVKKRDVARKANEWDEADRLRNGIHDLGFEVDDTEYGYLIKKRAKTR